jgi:hypothetical protein
MTKLKEHNISEKLAYGTPLQKQWYPSAETKFGKNMCPKNSEKLYTKVDKMNSHYSKPRATIQTLQIITETS